MHRTLATIATSSGRYLLHKVRGPCRQGCCLCIVILTEVLHGAWGRYRQRSRYTQGHYIQWVLYLNSMIWHVTISLHVCKSFRCTEKKREKKKSFNERSWANKCEESLPSFAPGKKVSSKRDLQGSSELDVPCDFSYRGVKKRCAEKYILSDNNSAAAS